jgi:hypothetical protein
VEYTIVSPRSLRSRLRSAGLGAHLRVQRGRRLVQDEQPRPVQQGAGELHAAGQTARQLLHEAAGAVRQSEGVQQLCDPCGRLAALDAVKPGVEPEVPVHGQVAVQRRFLEDHAQVAAHLGGMGVHVSTEDADRAAAQRLQGAQRLQQAGLAGPVGSEQGDDLARLDVDGQVAHGRYGSVGDVDVVDGDCCGVHAEARTHVAPSAVSTCSGPGRASACVTVRLATS